MYAPSKHAALALLCVPLFVACGAAEDGRSRFDVEADAGAGDAATPPPLGDSGAVAATRRCSADGHAILDGEGAVVQRCGGTEGCDERTFTCIDACQAAAAQAHAVGCEYYATYMEQVLATTLGETPCFAAIVANTWDTPAHLAVDGFASTFAMEQFTRIPVGSGENIRYEPYSADRGLAPGQVAVVFLSGEEGPAPLCPAPSAIPRGTMVNGSGIGSSFRIRSDVPVVAYEINPYGGGAAHTTGASLLLATGAWGTNYVAANAYAHDLADPSLNIVAMADDTKVTLVPRADIVGGNGVPAGRANVPWTITLQQGQQVQLSQPAELTGSVVQSSKPVGLMAGHACARIPVSNPYCDHAEQMIPQVKALGSEYVGVMHLPRAGEPGLWRLVGVVPGTKLSWSAASNVGGPSTLGAGETVELLTDAPFVVKSQDEAHPFLLFSYMVGNQWKPALDGIGDADFVLGVPPKQWMNQYVFYTDPTYPSSHVVLVRGKSEGAFRDVTLDCAGVVRDWAAVGDFEYARVELTRKNFARVGDCASGRHEIKSEGPFGLWVWGWGSPDAPGTRDVSYGYPGGMNVQPINRVYLPPVPR